MDDFETIILNTLLDKYEKSKGFSGENKTARKVAIKVAALFPGYDDHANFELFQAVNEAVADLLRRGLVNAKINRARVCREVVLNPEGIEAAYQVIGRTHKKTVHQTLLAILERFRDRDKIIDRFCLAQSERIRANKPVQFYHDDLTEFEQILMAAVAATQVETETYVRDFSVRVFRDSKVFERIRAKVINLLFEYGDFPEKDQVLESMNIVKNPTYVNFKGAGTLFIAGQRLGLDGLKGDIAISSALLADIERIEIIGRAVMTVENLTSFHTADCQDVFLIYLGGFHNRIRREFVQKIHRQNPGVPFYHCGDIDAGGFYILEHLRRLSGVAFQPYKMDLATLKQYQHYAKPLTENDRERLQRLMGGENDEIIRYMLENNCKLEQEVVRF